MIRFGKYIDNVIANTTTTTGGVGLNTLFYVQILFVGRSSVFAFDYVEHFYISF